jgi:hypothetical protein
MILQPSDLMGNLNILLGEQDIVLALGVVFDCFEVRTMHTIISYVIIAAMRGKSLVKPSDEFLPADNNKHPFFKLH